MLDWSVNMSEHAFSMLPLCYSISPSFIYGIFLRFMPVLLIFIGQFL